MSSKDNLGDRMKSFEQCFRTFIPTGMPIVLRLDGKSFHSYTKGCKRPIDENLVNCMNETVKYLCANLQGAQLGYVQSDEISILINNYTSLESQPVFGNSLNKILSISAGMASAFFTMNSASIFNGVPKLAVFDSRLFVLPKEEVNNSFLWRQQDCTRNSIQMLARSLYSHKELHNKNTSDLQELCFQKGINWNDLPTYQKRGRCIVKSKVTKECKDRKTGEMVLAERSEWKIDNEIPIFSKDPNYINQHV